MFGIEEYGTFIAAVLTFQAVPGAGTIAILSSTARDGRRSGAAAVAGTLTGDFVFMALAAAGVAGIIGANDLLFHALRLGGSLYLAWMGVSLIRDSFRPSPDEPGTSLTVAAHFRKAFAVSISNPKVMLFFVSFFPLFLPENAPRSTVAWMMLHVTALSALWQFGLVVLGNGVARRLRGAPRAREWGQRLAGVLLVGFGIRLAASH